MHRLPEADDIIALGLNGNIGQQGSFEALKSASGYVKSLEVADKMRERDDDAESESESEHRGEKPTALVVDEPDDLGKTTDRTIWSYYFSSLGWFRIGIFGLLVAINQGFDTLSCKIGRTHARAYTEWCRLTCFRCLGNMVGTQ